LIFEDQDKLSPMYVPKVLPHREKQIDFLASLYRNALDDVSKAYMHICQLIGPVGTGKTSSALHFAEKVEKSARGKGFNIKHLYVNGKLEGASCFTLYNSMLDKVARGSSTRSLSPEEMLRRLVCYLENNDSYLIITATRSAIS